MYKLGKFLGTPVGLVTLILAGAILILVWQSSVALYLLGTAFVLLPVYLTWLMFRWLVRKAVGTSATQR